MKKLNIKLNFKKRIVLLFSIISLNTTGQNMLYDYFSTLNFTANNFNIRTPLMGGFNNPNISEVDLNGDGVKDLIFFERSSNKIIPFKYIGNGSNFPYEYAPQYRENFPDLITDFLKMIDLNCDGIPELLHRQGSLPMAGPGVWYYKGIKNAKNEWTYSTERELRYYETYDLNNSINIYVNPGGDIPAIEDVDMDGDMDIISFNVISPYMHLYKNMKVEYGLSCDSNYYLNVNSGCYGKVIQTGQYYTLNAQCKTDSELGKTTHGLNSCLCSVNFNSDTLNDILSASGLFSNSNLLLNNSNLQGNNIVFNTQDTVYTTTNGYDVQIKNMPCAFYLDYTKDGKKEILFSGNSDLGQTHNMIISTENIGTTSSPIFIKPIINYFDNNYMLDLGQNSHPVFYDYDKDGDQDLFIGIGRYYSLTDSTNGRLFYFKNTGTITAPNFVLQTSDFLNLTTRNLYSVIHPAFGDVDNDGDDDLLIGHENNCAFAKNTANNPNVQPVFSYISDTFPAIQSMFSYWQNRILKNFAPCLFDYSGDGKLDILFGEKYGNILYLQNNTTNSQTPSFTPITQLFGGVDVSGDNDPFFNFQSTPGYSVPVICKIDNINDSILLIGSLTGNLHTYKLETDPNSFFQNLSTKYENINTGLYACPAIYDLFADNKKLILVGNFLGGLEGYKRIKDFVGTNNTVLPYQNLIKIFPNPATNQVQISMPEFVAKSIIKISLVNALGQTIEINADHNNPINLNIEHYQSGIYWIYLFFKDETKTIYKFLKI